MQDLLTRAAAETTGGSVFGYRVADPERYGVVAFDDEGRAVNIEEKPEQPKSRYAVTGLYFLDAEAPARAKRVKPSARGELEIVSVLETYLDEGSLRVERMGRGYAWLDTGTHDSLVEAAEFVRTIERRQGLKIGCPEEIAFEQGWIDAAALHTLGEELSKTDYGQYLLRIAGAASS